MGLPEQNTEEGKPWTERLTSGSSAKPKLTTNNLFHFKIFKTTEKSRIFPNFWKHKRQIYI